MQMKNQTKRYKVGIAETVAVAEALKKIHASGAELVQARAELHAATEAMNAANELRLQASDKCQSRSKIHEDNLQALSCLLRIDINLVDF